MSATGRSDVRKARDFYATPKWVYDRLDDAIGDWLIRPSSTVLEPCAGDGRLADAISARRPGARLQLLDIAPRRADIERAAYLETGRYPCDVCVTNPPFYCAYDFALKAVGECTRVALLLPISFLSSSERSHWLRSHPPSIYVLPNRPSFTGWGADAQEYAWFVWGQIRPEVMILNETHNAIRAAEKREFQRCYPNFSGV